eukprot:484436-Amphidinium_carterae.2
MVPLQYALPDVEAQDVVMTDILAENEITERAQAVVRTWGGYHFRSLVCACLLVKELPDNVSLTHVLKDTTKRFAEKMSPQDKEGLRQYVQLCVSKGVAAAEAAQPLAQKYLSTQKAVPPVLVAFVYDTVDGFASLQHLAQKIFESSCFQVPEKQLQLCGMYFDQFRAMYGLPVVPQDMHVVDSVESAEFYKGLTFPKKVATQLSDVSFFETVGPKSNRMTRRKASSIPEAGYYYHPGAEGHPWVDRLCVAQNGAASCLVLYQDKINKALPETVASLNAAADLFKKEGWKVLCVAHVVDASADTTKQKNFKHPHMLVRGSEVEAFYTPSFSPAVHFLKARHREASGSSG